MHFCTFGQAKRLKKLGAKQKSNWYYWQEEKNGDEILSSVGEIYDFNEGSECGRYFDQTLIYEKQAENLCWAAFDTQTLGEMIGKIVKEFSQIPGSSFGQFILVTSENKTAFWKFEEIYTPTSEDETVGRAEFLIYLLENKEIKTNSEEIK